MKSGIEAKAKVTSKGQVTIPNEIRRRLGVQPGDEILFVEDKDGVHLRRLIPDSVFEKWTGYLTELVGRRSDELVDEMRGR
ncbi:MAG TPA: AbrB/MazE/SpoVT family DNA-binding domain-containing protein [Dehalococcoidia bacterium]|nr:AbrB/MazE/SpoVT family DNA-binding domain-containing protein [Dehalococcoidia bacterium]